MSLDDNKIHGYKFLKRLNRGNQGYVDLVTKRGKEYVMKTFGDIDDMKREVGCLSKLQKLCSKEIKEVICLHDVIELEDGTVKIVIDYLRDYVTLKNFMDENLKDMKNLIVKIDRAYDRGRDEEAEEFVKVLVDEYLPILRKIRNKIIKGLVKLESVDILHSDLDTGLNIMINPETLNIKIIDFGMCKESPRPELLGRDFLDVGFYMASFLMGIIPTKDLITFVKPFINKIQNPQLKQRFIKNLNISEPLSSL